jgi:hypothetical protein
MRHPEIRCCSLGNCRQIRQLSPIRSVSQGVEVPDASQYAIAISRLLARHKSVGGAALLDRRARIVPFVGLSTISVGVFVGAPTPRHLLVSEPGANS